MKNNKIVLLLTILIFVFTIGSYAKTVKAYRLGTYPLVSCGVADVDSLKQNLFKNDEHVKKGFELAGYAELYLPFMNALETADIVEKELPTGTVLSWMIYRPGWKVRIAKDLEWASKKPLKVFAFTLKQGCTNYHFVIPKRCGNVSLYKITEDCPVCKMDVTPEKANLNDKITVDLSATNCVDAIEVTVMAADGSKVAGTTMNSAGKWETSFDTPGEYTIKAVATKANCETSGCEAKVVINAPPVCCVKVASDKKHYTNRPVVIDASCSNDPDGKIVKGVFEVKDEAGAVVTTQTVNGDQLAWENSFAKAGMYTICLTVEDDFGASCTSCETKLEVKRKLFFPMVAAGPMLAKGTYSGYLFARGGVGFWAIPDVLDLTLSVGGALTLAGEPFKSFVMGTLVMNYHAGPFYLGGGLGLTSNVRKAVGVETAWDGGLNLVANVGYDIFRTPTSAGSIFGELRIPTGSDYEFSKQHMILLGFKYIFNL